MHRKTYFVHLIGTLYFIKHAFGFGTASPPAHFNNFSIPGLTVEQQHSNWLEDIRQNISYRVKFENEMIPSDEALDMLLLDNSHVETSRLQHMLVHPHTLN